MVLRAHELSAEAEDAFPSAMLCLEDGSHATPPRSTGSRGPPATARAVGPTSPAAPPGPTWAAGVGHGPAHRTPAQASALLQAQQLRPAGPSRPHSPMCSPQGQIKPLIPRKTRTTWADCQMGNQRTGIPLLWEQLMSRNTSAFHFFEWK